MPGTLPCKSCVYGRFPKIPPTPIKSAELAIVGEAPGTQEIIQKAPFVGPSGELLRKAFHSVGLPDLSQVYITNSLLCRPPTGKPISRDAIRNCRDRLLVELADVHPKVVIAFGNTAVEALTGKKSKITQTQGTLITEHLLPFDCVVVPVLHPAAILRSGGRYPQFILALRRVRQVFSGSFARPGETKFHVVRTQAELDRAIDALSKYEYLSADVETGIQGQVRCLGVAWQPGKVLTFPEELIPHLDPLLSAPGPRWIWHNGQFDVVRLNKLGLHARLDEDTILLHYALNEETGTHDLEQLATTLLGAEPWKHMVKPYSKDKRSRGFADVPPSILYPYNAYDCDYTLQLFHKLKPQVEADPDLKILYNDLLLPASRLLGRIEMKGMRPVPEILDREEEAILAELAELDVAISQCVQSFWDPELYAEQTGVRVPPSQFNPGSPKQLAWLLWDRLRLMPKYRQGKSTNAGVLEQIQDHHEIVKLILQRRSLKKLHSNYIVGTRNAIEADGRVHSNFKVFGTATGRLSSSDPNLQNVPKQMRSIYQAEPGYTLIELDYKGAELRVLAHISGDKYLREVFEQGRDLHTEVAVLLFGENFTHAHRMKAKTVNFGIVYGRRAQSLAQAFDISLEEAQDMIDKWFERAPQADAYLRSCDEAVRRGEVLISPFHRKRRFGLITPDTIDHVQNEARNFRIQSTASDLTLLSAIELQPILEAKYDASIVNLVHDSILIEAPTQYAMEVVKLAVDTMRRVPEERLHTTIPFDVEAKMGDNWGQMEEVLAYAS